MKSLFLFVMSCLSLTSLRTFAQAPNVNNSNSYFRRKYLPVYADCDSPIVIDVQPGSSYGYTVPPAGAGRKQEIVATNRNSTIAIEREHNSAWYQLHIAYDGELCFDIIPEDSTNDYDFLLYTYTGANFCKQLHQKLIRPVRSNIRRNTANGITGLRPNAPYELQGEGPGLQFSKLIQVKKGEQYMLVLDNVYSGGKGHMIRFYYHKKIEVNGTVTDDSGHPINGANITIIAPSGETLLYTKTDASGKYSTRLDINELISYYVIAADNLHLFDEKIVNTENYTGEQSIMLKHVLHDIKAGQHFALKSMHFYNGSAQPMPEAYKVMGQLLSLMRKNPSLNILIEGHVTDSYIGDHDSNGILQKLSEDRAYTIYNYLVQNGIDSKRMKTVGMGNRRMIYPNPHNEAEHATNRRVEIKVLSE